MAKGRKPDPPELKILKGGKRPGSPSGKGAKDLPRCPVHLDEVARAEWSRIVPELAAAGTLAAVDGAALAIYCNAFSRWIRANEDVRAIGTVIETDLGGTKANPAVAAAAAAEALMLRLLESFGATPSSRMRVHAAAEAPRDQLSEFLSRRSKA